MPRSSSNRGGSSERQGSSSSQRSGTMSRSEAGREGGLAPHRCRGQECNQEGGSSSSSRGSSSR